MTALRRILTLILALISLNALATSGASTTTIAPMLAKVTPAIVNITVEEKMPPELLKQLPPTVNPDSLPKGMAIGSGVIFDASKGYILTNNHVVKNQKAMVVTLKDGRRFRAKLIAHDDDFDLAVIQIPHDHLTSLPFGNSDELKVGDFVAAIGSPYGLTQTVTSGVVSALDRDHPRIEGFQSFIQTDAPINPGNSGGALVNMQGHLVGVNTAIFSTSGGNIGIGFAIPSNMTKAVIHQLLTYGKVERGMLGVMAQNISPELKDALHLSSSNGVLITQVVPASPAAKAGLHAQDIIMSLNGNTIHNSDQLHNDLGLMRPGTAIELGISRQHSQRTIHAVVADPKKIMQQRQLPFIGGLTLQDFDELEPDGTRLKGAVIINVTDVSDAALAGLNPGDVITAAAGKAVESVNALQKIAESINSKQLLLTIKRGHTNLYIVVT